jgi:5-(carboxyamino)imidazole ribonucleotide mutase
MTTKPKSAGRTRPGRRPVVGLLMGSTSDWETMRHAAETLEALGIPYERRVMSAHRTPRQMIAYATGAAARGLRVVIGGAGGAAHLAGLVAALTPIPVLGVPMESASLKGMDSLLSIVQMPGGVPVATFAIGKPGAINAGLFAAAILAHGDPAVRRALSAYRAAQTRRVLRSRLP